MAAYRTLPYPTVLDMGGTRGGVGVDAALSRALDGAHVTASKNADPPSRENRYQAILAQDDIENRPTKHGKHSEWQHTGSQRKECLDGMPAGTNEHNVHPKLQ